MASRRMRIKAMAKVPSVGKPRGLERTETPVNLMEPSSPLAVCNNSNPLPGIESENTRISSPRPPTSPSPLSFSFPSPAASLEKGTNPDETKFISLPSSGGLVGPKSPSNFIRSPSPVHSPIPFLRAPDSPRRPSTPNTPNPPIASPAEVSQGILSPVYSPSYSVMSPGCGPGIQRVVPPPSPSSSSSRDSSNPPPSPRYNSGTRPPSSHGGKSMPTFASPHSTSNTKMLKDASSTSLISQVLNNSDTLRQRLQSGTAAPTTSKYAMIRKDYLAKYQNNLPNPKDLTMLHYAFFNPPKSEGKDQNPEDSDGKIAGTPKKRRRTESRDSIASSVSVKSMSPEKIPDPDPDPDNDLSDSVGPRVKVGPDGQLILDEQSLVIETSESLRAKKQLANMETVSGSSFIVGSSGIYSRKKSLNRGLDWDEKETMKFYRALITCGTDFSMMATVFKGTRTRGELKAKFKREDRKNPQQVSNALAKQCFDPTLALTDSEDEEVAVLEAAPSGQSSLDEYTDIGDIENMKSSTRRYRKEVIAKKEDFKKTLSAVKKKGGLNSNVLPKPHELPFRRPSGHLDWRLYAVMKNNLTGDGAENSQTGSSPSTPSSSTSGAPVDPRVINLEISNSTSPRST